MGATAGGVDQDQELLDAACDGDVARVRAAQAAGASLIATTPGTSTALHAAAWLGHTEIVLFLLESPADGPPGVPIDLPRSAGGDTPLLLAAANGHSETVKLLLERGVRTQPHLKLYLRVTFLLCFCRQKLSKSCASRPR